MDFSGDEYAASQTKMEVDDDIMNICKKRRREEDLDDEFQNRMASAIARSVTAEEDDAFMFTLLEENSTSTTQPSLGLKDDAAGDCSGVSNIEAPMQLAKNHFDPQPTATLEADTSAAGPKKPTSLLFGDHARGHTAQLPAMRSEAPTVDSKMPALEAPSAQLAAMPRANAPTAEDSKMPAAEVSTQQAALLTQFATLPPLTDMHSMTQPPPTMDMEKFVERWTCDICKSCSFETFEEAQAHEIQCRLYQDAKQKSEDANLKSQMSEAADVLTTLALRPPTQTVQADDGNLKLPALRHPRINLIPQGDAISMLSNYNNLLVQNIEFFYPSSDDRVGLRCIHCKDHPQHITAATFFPSTVGSISSGLGTIGARHFGWGKCPFVQPETVQRMIETKKTSGLQTRTNGRVGLDAYCKNLAKQYGIFDGENNSGTYFLEGTEPDFSITDDMLQRKLSSSSRGSTKSSSDHSSATDSNSIASVLANMKNDVNIEMRPFIPSDTQHFWECSGCRSLSFDFRAPGSVVWSVGEPSRNKIEAHIKHCTGGKPLAIPRSATIEPYYGEGVPTIKVKWDSKLAKRSSGRMRSSLGALTVKPGVEDVALCFEEDQQFTTEFAYFTVTQLKKCYLTKSGGSRGSCPLGFGGLACGYCAGKPNERRFFYTSADHLRNSFSHIPSHMAECKYCPTEVKVRLEELKTVRNRQKSLLKPGYHKIFIDRVWEKMHGPPLSDDDTDDEGFGSYSSRADLLTSKRKPFPSDVRVAITLVQDADGSATSDLNYLTLLQLEAFKTPGQSASNEDEDSCQIAFPGLCCRWCMKNPKGRKFFTTSSDHLGDLLLTISDHMMICKECPANIKSQISSYKATHSLQLQQLKDGEHNACMDRVWKRLTLLNRDTHQKPAMPAARTIAPIQYNIVDPNMALVTEYDESLVTPFTSFTMQQVQPCNLDNSGNGSRSAFDYGFPGLECRHCAGQPNPRRFFYRTAEILGGNYAHIPNHLMACSACPPETKRTLKALKEAHLTLKHTLLKGSQKEFFNSLWQRLHGGSAHVPLRNKSL